MPAGLTPAEIRLLDGGDEALAMCRCTVCPQIAARGRDLADSMRKAMPDASDVDLARMLLAAVEDIGLGDIQTEILGLFTWAACELTAVERALARLNEP
jgi:hypothetical protein